MRLNRKEFLKSTLATVGVSVGVGLGLGLTAGSGCGSDGTGGGTGGTGNGTGGSGSGGAGSGGAGGGGANACTAAPTTTIATNHGHTLAIPLADVTQGTMKTYSIMGTSTHDHTITITAAQFTLLRDGSTYSMMSSSGGGHTHVVNVMCG